MKVQGSKVQGSGSAHAFAADECASTGADATGEGVMAAKLAAPLGISGGTTRLVSIIAPGGYGKSRISAQLCANLLESFALGVFFVELAPVREHTDIASALAGATGFQFNGTRDPKDQLIDYLREKEMLLCFDNFEHVLEGAPFIADILKAAPGVKAVVTLREPLRIAGEQVYRLEPLGVGGPAGGTTNCSAKPIILRILRDGPCKILPRAGRN